ncbi:Crp/Fnr family transcriptional regulator [Streptoalloteichus hindustanus]|uniref:cAMP-binding domain of CRP or a regulatory subunit of cAMP-dependent protein kinases n=1 Tax=Streptoalloteichus hindustanus TaxID=2017 RepID=A0A1M4ZAD4_STRHI|nr:Crp/Fnr family transcriptional regulator [Streptoalloteichus hindustanus]SHF15001.1 cAMP-binding domain of CRP or a regulatory subunit of cAMP-dependent protein kinases [Streptoalloteichus hindustanus]
MSAFPPSDAVGANTPFFSAIPPSERAELRALGDVRPYAARQTVLRVADPGVSAVVLLSGYVKIVGISVAGAEAVLDFLGPGDIVGEFAVLDGRPRSASVVALTPLSALVVPAPALRAFLDRHPRTAALLHRTVLARVRQANHNRTEHTGVARVERRLTRLLLDLARRFGRQERAGVVIGVPLSQEDVASCVAASREQVIRALRVLRRDGVVAVRRREITLLRPEPFAGWAAPGTSAKE